MKSWHLTHDGDELMRCRAVSYQHARSLLWWRWYRAGGRPGLRFHECRVSEACPTTKVHRVKPGRLRQRLVRQLESEPQTVHELAKSCGASDTAVRGMLRKMRRDGTVEQVGKRPTTNGRQPQVWGLA